MSAPARSRDEDRRASGPVGAALFALDTSCCSLGALLEDGDGPVWVADPREADILVVAGPINRRAESELVRLYDTMPNPKRVLAVGSCARSGGPFRSYPGILGGTGAAIPIDGKVAGCPPARDRVLSEIARMMESIETRGESRRSAGGTARGERASGAKGADVARRKRARA